MTPDSALFDAYNRPVRMHAVPEPPVLDEVAARGRDDIFLGYIRTTGLSDNAIVLNPDAILSAEARGQGLALYDEMLRDPKIASAMEARQLAVVGKEWRVLPASDDADDVDAAALVKAELERVPCFHLDLMQAMDALPKGFAIQEVLWELANDLVRVRDLRHRDPRRFAFSLGGELRLLTIASPLEGEAVPARKFLHYAFNPRYENPYGEALCARVYWWWWFKKHAVKFWTVFMEKFGQPTAVGKYQPGATPEQKDTLLSAIAAIQNEYAVSIPETMKIELLEAQRAGSINTYETFCQYCDEQIALAICGQTLTSQVGDRGSYAAAKVHNDVRQDYVEADAKTLCATINGSLIPWFVDYNLRPSPAGYPMWVLMVTPEADLVALSERDNRLEEMGLRIPARYVYDTYRIPAPSGDEEVLVPAAPSSPATATPPMPMPAGAPMMTAAAAFADAPVETAADQIAAAATSRVIVVYDGLLTELRRELENAAGYEAAVARLDGAFSADDQRPLAELLHATLLTANLVGQADILDEAARVPAAFAVGDVIAPLPPEEALRFFQDKVPMTRAQFDALSAPLRARAFTLARADSVSLVDAVKRQLTASLTEGTTFTDFLVGLNRVFDAAGVTRANPSHASTVFVTNTQTAYQAGRYEQLSTPGLDELFPWFEYHTAGDERVRPTHALMNHVIAVRTNPVWDLWWPPNGFNCRCTVTAISRAEIRRRGLQLTSVPRVQPDRGFASNPAKLLRGAA